MKKEQTFAQKINARYNRLNKVIEHAEKGKGWIRPTSTGYSERQKEQYAAYDSLIARCNEQIEKLKEMVVRHREEA